MKNLSVAIGAAIVSLFAVPGMARAGNPDHVRQLLQTNTCKGCDLSDTRLVGLDLTEANLSNANLQGANLNGSQLSRANLRGANLHEANITGAHFVGANLRGANLTNAKHVGLCNSPLFKYDQLSSTHSSASNCLAFSLVSAFGAKLCEPDYGLGELNTGKAFCRMIDDEVTSSQMIGNLSDFLRTSSFYGADLTNAMVQSVDLTGTDFRYASLMGTSFQDTTLDYALFLNANIQNIDTADLENTVLTDADIKRLITDAIAQEKNAARQSEGSATMGMLNRAQQAYRLENNQFATRVSDLGVGISSTENFDYDVVPQSDPMKSAVMRAKSKVADLHSFVGIVWQGEEAEDYQFSQLICKTLEPSMELPTISNQFTQRNATLQCPEGMKSIN